MAGVDRRAVARLAPYRLPQERVVVAMQEHWASRFEPFATTTVGFLLVITIGTVAPTRMGALANAAWWLWFLLLLRLAWRILQWNFSWFVATDKRLLLVYGIITRKVAMMPMARVTDMSYTRTPLGRVLGYGTFVLESAGQDQALSRIRYVRDPDRTYRRICDQIFGSVAPAQDAPGADAAGADAAGGRRRGGPFRRRRGGGPDEGRPGGGPPRRPGPRPAAPGTGPGDAAARREEDRTTAPARVVEATDVPLHRMGEYLEPARKGTRRLWRRGEERLRRGVQRPDRPRRPRRPEPPGEEGSTDEGWSVSREHASEHHAVETRRTTD